MRGKKSAAEQIVAKLREAEVILGKGMALGEVCRQLEITDVTYNRWTLGRCSGPVLEPASSPAC